MRLIDADNLKQELIRWFPQLSLEGIEGRTLFKQILHDIDNAPTVDFTFEEIFQKTICENRLYCPARPTGEWIADHENYMCYCSKCEYKAFHPHNFCPNCGAKMKGENYEAN